MLSLSLQPLLDNVERVGLGPALRILRAVAHMTRRTVEGQALELDWVRSNTWQLDDDDYLEMVELQDELVLVHHTAAGRRHRRRRRTDRLAPLESLGRHIGAAFQITDDLLNLRADPEDYGKEIGGDLWEGKRTLMLLHALRSAEPDDQGPRRADPRQAPPERRRRARARPTCWIGSRHAVNCPGPGGPRSSARLQGQRTWESKSLDDIRWLYGLMQRVGSLEHARDSRRPTCAARRRPCSPIWTGCRPAGTGTCWPASSTTCTGGRDDRPEVLVGMLAELERIRELTLDLVEREAPRLLPPPPDESLGAERTMFDLLLGARRAVLGNPAAARGLHDLLVAEGRRYAETPAGAQLRDALVASEAVENLRRIWETVSLNVLDGPAASEFAPRTRGPNCWPTPSSGMVSTTPSWRASGRRASHDAHRAPRGAGRAEQSSSAI